MLGFGLGLHSCVLGFCRMDLITGSVFSLSRLLILYLRDFLLTKLSWPQYVLGYRLSYYAKGQVTVTESQGVWHLWQARAQCLRLPATVTGHPRLSPQSCLASFPCLEGQHPFCFFLLWWVMINLGARVLTWKVHGGFVFTLSIWTEQRRSC